MRQRAEIDAEIGRLREKRVDLLPAASARDRFAELVAYLAIATEEDGALIDDTARATIAWTDTASLIREAIVPRVVFARSRPGADVVGAGGGPLQRRPARHRDTLSRNSKGSG